MTDDQQQETCPGTGIKLDLNFQGRKAIVLGIYLPPGDSRSTNNKATCKAMHIWIKNILVKAENTNTAILIAGDLNRLDEDTTPSAGAVYRRLWDDTLFSEAWWKCNGHANDQTYPFGTSNKKLDFIFLSGWLAEGIQQCSKSLRASLINEDHAQLWTEIVGYIPPGGPAYTAAKGAPKLAVKQASKAAREAFQHEIEKVLGIIETDDQLTDLTNLLPSHVGGNQATRADASVIEEGEGLEDTIYQIAAKHFPLATTLRKRSILFLKTRQLTTLHTHIGRVAAKWPQRPHVLIKLVEKATKLLGP
ncbi:hypothetical protein GGH92_009242, partial [Coemansia sp. RSA 2673]